VLITLAIGSVQYNTYKTVISFSYISGLCFGRVDSEPGV
jgi:hypothetical protein